ncbi:MAG: LysR family transcriptional regulator [Pseudomonadota bacterium]|nr:LysR family transcriptional regulator [Pseudomonadota bacterium]
MANPIDWTLYRTFLGVLREGSLSGAARTLGITQPTAGRHVAALERALRVVLFTRSPSGLQPTEAALALQPLVKAMADTAAALERAASARGEGGDDALRGVVRITASDVIGLEVLPPVLARLRERHRALVLELALTDRVEDLLHGEADIAVRMVRPGQERLIARRIGEVELGMHASRGYIARHGAPGDVQELLGHSLVGFDRETPFLRDAARRLGGIGRETFALRCDSNAAQLAMIRAGAGIGMCQVALAGRGEPLVRVLPEAFSLRLEVWLTMHEDLRHSPRCRVVFDALARALGAYVGSIEASADTAPGYTK